MKVKIKKEGKEKEFNLINSWEDVTLDKWIKLIKLKDKSKSKEALETITALSDIPKKLLKQLEIKDIAVIMGKLAEMQQKENSSLKKIIKIEGKEYGFHPDLDSITLGEYAEIETFLKKGIEKHLPEVMAVLYRPIVAKENNIYSIEAYDGDIRIRAEQMKKMSAGQVESALRFFFALGKELLMILPSSLMERVKEMKMQLSQNPSAKDGVGSE
jgi:hypothetical protein